MNCLVFAAQGSASERLDRSKKELGYPFGDGDLSSFFVTGYIYPITVLVDDDGFGGLDNEDNDRISFNRQHIQLSSILSIFMDNSLADQ